MLSAIQVKENEKRKHASLTVVGTKQDSALRSREEQLLEGDVGQSTPDVPREKNGRELESRNRMMLPPTGVYPSG
jgi:hypothetical protein